MAPLPRPLLGLFLLANSLLLPGSVQGVPVDAHVPGQSWNSTGPSNSSHLVPRPPKPWGPAWAPAPFFWNAAPPRPYHAYGFGGFYHPGKGHGDERGPPNDVHPGYESEDAAEAERFEDDDREEPETEDQDVSSFETEESGENDEDSNSDESAFWNPYMGPRHDDEDEEEEGHQKPDYDRKPEHWDWKQQGHGHGKPW